MSLEHPNSNSQEIDIEDLVKCNTEPFGWYYTTNFLATFSDSGFTKSKDVVDLLKQNDRYIVTELYDLASLSRDTAWLVRCLDALKQSGQVDINAINNPDTIRPGVVIDGQTFHPPGWMYVIAIALNGDQWAIDETRKPEFKQQIRDHYKAMGEAAARNEIDKIEKHLTF